MNEYQLDQVYQIIAEHPGILRRDLAKILNVRQYRITRALLSMERNGFLLYEDDERQLWAFEVVEHTGACGNGVP